MSLLIASPSPPGGLMNLNSSGGGFFALVEESVGFSLAPQAIRQKKHSSSTFSCTVPAMKGAHRER